MKPVSLTNKESGIFYRHEQRICSVSQIKSRIKSLTQDEDINEIAEILSRYESMYCNSTGSIHLDLGKCSNYTINLIKKCIDAKDNSSQVFIPKSQIPQNPKNKYLNHFTPTQSFNHFSLPPRPASALFIQPSYITSTDLTLLSPIQHFQKKQKAILQPELETHQTIKRSYSESINQQPSRKKSPTVE
jgi:hypothetical protein